MSTNRVCAGLRQGNYGFYVSKPGADVLTCGPDDLLLDSDNAFGQFYAKGSLLLPANSTDTVTAYFPDAGYTPYPLLVQQIVSPSYGTFYSTYLGYLNINVGSNYISASVGLSPYTSDVRLYYGLLTTPA